MQPRQEIIIEPLKKALAKLAVALARALQNLNDEELRDATIQRFEYSFELCWKLLKRQLEAEIGNTEEVDGLSKKQLFRIAGEKGLINDVSAWFVYLEKRSLSSHTYHLETAQEVFKVIPDFLQDANHLFQLLEKRNA